MTREELRQYRHLVELRNNLEDQLEKVKKRQYSPRAIVIDRMLRSSARKRAPFEDWVAKKQQEEDHLKKRIARLTFHIEAIKSAIAILPLSERELLTSHYIDGLSWEAVGELHGYDERTCRRKHEQAPKRLKT